MTKYKVIDGVAYEVKELDITVLKAEVDKAVEEVESLELEKSKAMASIKNATAQYDNQVENYKKQIANLQMLIATIEDKKLKVIEPEEAKIKECDTRLIGLRASFYDKNEVVSALLPAEAKKLGL